MIECICINDIGRPTIIPIDKWVVKGNKYHITHIGSTLGTSILCVTLSEINLGEKYYHYEGFRLDRFAFNKESAIKLLELMKQCSELNGVNIGDLMPNQIEELCV